MPIYCDHNASTPLRPEVLEAMLPFMRGEYGNASSVHALGSRARCAVEDARAEVAALVGAQPAEVIFTSGGTESNNLAIQGMARASTQRTIVSTPIEHASVREAITTLRRDGYATREVPIDAAGRVVLSALPSLLDERPAVVSIGWANNEIGTLQPIEDIGRLCQAYSVPLHVDAVQAAGKIPVHVRGVELLSVSAHKIGGPKGVGALFVRRGTALRPLLVGGGQERGLRAGTENVAAIAGMAAACRLAVAELHVFGEACAALREHLWNGLAATIPGARRNSPGSAECLPNTLNVTFAGVRGEALVAALDLEGVAVSGGSACAGGAGEPSHVLIGIGRSVEEARDGVRFSLGRTNRREEIERVVCITAACVRRTRSTEGCGRNGG